MPRLGKVGNGIIKRSRGRRTFVIKNSGTTMIGSRGKRVSVNYEYFYFRI